MHLLDIGDYWIVMLVLGTLVIPTAAYATLRNRAPPDRNQRLVGWWCLWTGQLAVAMLCSAWIARDIARGFVHSGNRTAAMIYGVGGALVAAVAAVVAVRVFVLGLSVLRRRSPATIARNAWRIHTGATVPLLGSLAIFGLMYFEVQLPRRFDHARLLLGVLSPTCITSSLLFIVAGTTGHTHRGRRA